MKKLLLLVAFTLISITAANAATDVKLNLSGDAYWTTDNAQVGMGERQLTATNLFKDRFGTNNVLLSAEATNEDWKATFSLAHYGAETGIGLNDACASLRLFDKLWLNAGYFANWDGDYTYNNWFTQSSLTELMCMASPYVAASLSYDFPKDITLNVGLMNTASWDNSDAIENNTSKTFFAKVDWANICKDWGLTVSFLTGNEESFETSYTRSMSELYLKFGGHCCDNLEGIIEGKLFMKGETGELESINAFSAQIMARYHFNDKFSVGARVGYTADEDALYLQHQVSGLDAGIVCQYNPVEYAYLRLEGGLLSLSNSDNDTMAEIFKNDDEFSASRLGVALSMGFNFDLFSLIHK
ncbi:MAG: porin [Ignavibacteria bacterium]|jgi:hypothetical protein|nr:porin [Ignavibacteria bacterium]